MPLIGRETIFGEVKGDEAYANAHRSPLFLGPLVERTDAEFVLRNTQHCHGYYGGSSRERPATEHAMTDQPKKFKAIAFE